MKALHCFLGLLATAVACGQTTGGFDANPQNPANWDFSLPTIASGWDLASRNEWVTINGQQVLQRANYSKNWANPILYRNGVAMPGEALAYPFSRVTSEFDTVTMSSEGTVTKQLVWVNPFSPPPDAVRIRLSASAYALYSPSGTGTADNGLKSEIITFFDHGYFRVQMSDPEIRTVKVNNGVAEVQVSKSASAQASGAGSSGTVAHASAEGLAVQLDSRNVWISSASGPIYKPQQSTVASTNIAYTQWSSDFRTVIHRIYEYSRPIHNAIPVVTQYESPSVNLEVWRLSTPSRVVQTVRWLGENVISWRDPRTVPDSAFWMIGNASTELLVGETYQWSTGTAATLPNANGLYTVQPVALNRPTPTLLQHEFPEWRYEPLPTHYFRKYAEPGVSLDSPPTELTLRYTWADGVFGESKRIIQFINPEQLVHTGQTIEDWRLTSDFQSVNFENGLAAQPPTASSANVIFEKPYFSKSALTNVTGVLGPATVFGSTIGGVLAGPASIGASIAAVLGLYVMFLDAGGVVSTVQRGEYLAAGNLFEWWDGIDNDGQNGIDDLTERRNIYGTYNINNATWTVLIRPVEYVTPQHFMVFGPTGFVGDQIELSRIQQSGQYAPRLFKFWQNAGQGGGGGTGG